MKIEDLKDKMIGVVGYGIEGHATALYLLKHGLKPILFDQKPWDSWLEEDKNSIKNLKVNFAFGLDAFMELKGFDVVFRSPGVKLTDLKKQVSAKTIITSQTKWFFENCPARIIGVTGTKGKGTTVSLIFEMLEENLKYRVSKAGTKPHKNYLTGNIGKIQPFEILDTLNKNDVVVYELSSFQLQDLTLSPYISVVLMVTSEHLDYHKDIKEYREAKAPIAKFQKTTDFVIINSDYEGSVKIGEQSPGEKIYFSRQKSFDKGCYIKNGKIFFRGLLGGEHEIIQINDLQLRGEHNLENIFASVTAAKILGVKTQAIKECLKSFKGLEHRLEFIGQKKGIKFYNDSFSTTPETAIAAINSFNEKEVIILGGSRKKSDFSILAKTIIEKSNVKALILIGVEAPRIRQALENAGVFHGQILEGAKNMVEIFKQIKLLARPGDVVLFSPACASFDMFQNYKDRGDQFKLSTEKF